MAFTGCLVEVVGEGKVLKGAWFTGAYIKQEKTHQTPHKVLPTTEVCKCISISLPGGTEKPYLKNHLCHPFELSEFCLVYFAY